MWRAYLAGILVTVERPRLVSVPRISGAKILVWAPPVMTRETARSTLARKFPKPLLGRRLVSTSRTPKPVLRALRDGQIQTGTGSHPDTASSGTRRPVPFLAGSVVSVSATVLAQSFGFPTLHRLRRRPDAYLSSRHPRDCSRHVSPPTSQDRRPPDGGLIDIGGKKRSPEEAKIRSGCSLFDPTLLSPFIHCVPKIHSPGFA